MKLIWGRKPSRWRLSRSRLRAKEEIPFIMGRFKILEQTLKDLKSKGVPDDVLEKLESIKNQELVGEERFLGILKKTIGDEQTDKMLKGLTKVMIGYKEELICSIE